jgi:hypothetical protein
LYGVKKESPLPCPPWLDPQLSLSPFFTECPAKLHIEPRYTFGPYDFQKIAKKQFIEHFLGITILNLRNRRSCQGNQNFTRFHISMMLETAKMVLPEHQPP